MAVTCRAERPMNANYYLIRIVGTALTALACLLSTDRAAGQSENADAKPIPLLGSKYGTKKGGIVYSTGKGPAGKKFDIQLQFKFRAGGAFYSLLNRKRPRRQEI